MGGYRTFEHAPHSDHMLHAQSWSSSHGFTMQPRVWRDSINVDVNELFL